MSVVYHAGQRCAQDVLIITHDQAKPSHIYMQRHFLTINHSRACTLYLMNRINNRCQTLERAEVRSRLPRAVRCACRWCCGLLLDSAEAAARVRGRDFRFRAIFKISVQK